MARGYAENQLGLGQLHAAHVFRQALGVGGEGGVHAAVLQHQAGLLVAVLHGHDVGAGVRVPEGVVKLGEYCGAGEGGEAQADGLVAVALLHGGELGLQTVDAGLDVVARFVKSAPRLR
jgi:hypothetical protein